jgi:beta-galactosidase/beta-glucuronidase
VFSKTDPFLANMRTEVRQQVRCLQRHPSIILWAGNNEKEGALNFKSFAKNGKKSSKSFKCDGWRNAQAVK